VGLWRWGMLGTVWTMLALLGPVEASARGCAHPLGMATGQWEPYSYYDANHQYVGLDAEMVRAIMKEAGCQVVELDPKPATRNLSLFGKGEVDLMTGASRTAERLKMAWFSLPYRDETVGMFALADNIGRYSEIRTFADYLAGTLSMVAPRAGFYGVLYENHGDALQRSGRLSRFGDFAQGIRMLIAGRASFILGDAAAVEHAAARAGVRVQPLPFWLLEAPVHLMYSRITVSEADVQRIDAAIVRLQKRGALDDIRRSYGGM
jgi:polar amino acid transport system substrate-binding protein